jgi:hypothetical protein
MSVFDIFSKRKQRESGNIPDVYTYDTLPQPLRVQIVQIIQEAIGVDTYDDKAERAYIFIHATLCREYGVFSLGDPLVNRNSSPKDMLLNFILNSQDIDHVLDAVELTFKFIELEIPTNYDYARTVNTLILPEKAIGELNYRFKEHAVGYQYEASQLIRLDHTYTHANIARPTIALLVRAKFKGANEEYMKAHEHYRHGRNKECLTECLKAFESIMKIICLEKGWAFQNTDTSKRLIQICLQNGLVPSFAQSQFASLISLLESGIPTIRNKLGGHGQGQVPQRVDDEITRYALNLTGTNIIFLVEQSGL